MNDGRDVRHSAAAAAAAAPGACLALERRRSIQKITCWRSRRSSPSAGGEQLLPETPWLDQRTRPFWVSWTGEHASGGDVQRALLRCQLMLLPKSRLPRADCGFARACRPEAVGEANHGR